MQEPKEIFGGIPLHKIEARNQELWEWSAFPINRLLKKYFKFDSAKSNDMFIHKLYEADAIAELTVAYTDEGLAVPENIKSILQNKLLYLGHKIVRGGDRYDNYYNGIKIRD